MEMSRAGVSRRVNLQQNRFPRYLLFSATVPDGFGAMISRPLFKEIYAALNVGNLKDKLHLSSLRGLLGNELCALMTRVA